MKQQNFTEYDSGTAKEDAIDRMRKRPKNWMNLIMILLNIGVFLVVSATGGCENYEHMLRCGAGYAPFIAEGEYYRILTSMFLHFGIHHLANNMILLLFLGDDLERWAGKTSYLIIYLCGGMGGNLWSYFHDLQVMAKGQIPPVSAGASGGVFAVVGALVVLLAFRKGRLEDLSFRRMLCMAVLSLMVGFGSSTIDNYAHVGGAVTGAILMLILYPLWIRFRFDRGAGK